MLNGVWASKKFIDDDDPGTGALDGSALNDADGSVLDDADGSVLDDTDCNRQMGVVIGWTAVSSGTGHCWDHVLMRLCCAD